MRQKFASSLRLNINVDRPFKDIKAIVSPRTPKNPYKRMKDDEESQIALMKPDAAVISPWSSSEDYYLHTPPPIFTASPGPMSPPPAYDPNTPLRGNFNRDMIATTSARDFGTLPHPSTPTAEHEHASDDIQSLMQEVQTVIEFARDWAQESSSDPFVVGEIDSDDAASDTSSVWDANL
ncbi:hypothetical protein BDY19DRAFT_174424 [Irpex rosettiformis]|uniref:Uncharacterized protein n=1 Tax=Irpex rosettiformis TaxID=378272 RepID=A0ACB8U2S6_9APHY|nr:hypothetical protein BDY19DRAFT_174424 [Irpex rosettiformis]